VSFDDLVHRADPARGRGGDADPALLDRILSAGPARSPGGRNRAALLAAGLTVAVTLSVVGGITLARDDAPAPPVAAASTAAPTTPAAPVDCLALIRGWRPTYLPPGFVVDGKEQSSGKLFRQQNYVRRSARQPTTRTFVAVSRYCTDPSALPTGMPTREPDPDFTPPPPNLTVRGHPALRTGDAGLVRVDWDEAPGLSMSLITSTDPGDTLVSDAELVRIAAGLTQEATGADPSPPPSACPTLTSYRPAALPPGYRPGPTRPGPPEGAPSLVLTYLKGTGADQVTLLVNMACEVVLDETAIKRGEKVAINGKTGYLTPGARPVQVTWEEGPVEFWIIVGAESGTGAQPTLAEVLAVARSLRPT
jgi:hypothetical protein